MRKARLLSLLFSLVLAYPPTFRLDLSTSNGLCPFTKMGGAAVQSLTNAQKLSLPANTAAGKRVSVTDAVLVTGGSASGNIFVASSFLINGHTVYVAPNSPSQILYYNSDDGWSRGDWSYGDIGSYESADGENSTGHIGASTPWDETGWSDVDLTLTHPAIQQLAAVDNSQGGVAVLGGTQPGIYRKQSGLANGKDFFQILGNENGDSGDGAVSWYSELSDFGSNASGPGFVVRPIGGGNPLYYSLSNVAAPNLAGTDKAMMWDGTSSWGPDAPANGRPAYTELNGNGGQISWSGSQWDYYSGSSGYTYHSPQNVATPDLVTIWTPDDGGPALTVNNVAWLDLADNAASITVTSLSVAAINAGGTIPNDADTPGTIIASGNLNGRPSYVHVTGDASNDPIIWSNSWQDSAGTWITDNLPTLFGAADYGAEDHNGGAAGITRSDVANETRWQAVP